MSVCLLYPYKSTGLLIERLRVRIPARAAGDFLLHIYLYLLTLIRCPFQPRVTEVARKRSRSFCLRRRWQVTPKHAYTLDPMKWEWADYAAIQA